MDYWQKENIKTYFCFDLLKKILNIFSNEKGEVNNIWSDLKSKKDNGIVSEYLARPNELKSNPRWKATKDRNKKYFCCYGFHSHNNSLRMMK